MAARYGVDGKPVLVHPPLNASSRSRKMGHAQSLVIGIRLCTLRLYLRLQALCWQSLLFTLLIPHPTIRPITPYASLTLPRTVQLCQQGLRPAVDARSLGDNFPASYSLPLKKKFLLAFVRVPDREPPVLLLHLSPAFNDDSFNLCPLSCSLWLQRCQLSKKLGVSPSIISDFRRADYVHRGGNVRSCHDE